MRRRQGGGYRQNHGLAGVIYVLDNPGLRAGFFKIGCSRRSGYSRATDLNADPGTGTPGTFSCIFEYRTRDCGRAEQLVFRELKSYRRGKWGQEFFEVELSHAKQVIERICNGVDEEIVREQERALGSRLAEVKVAVPAATTVVPPAVAQPAQNSSFSWLKLGGMGALAVLIVSTFVARESSTDPRRQVTAAAVTATGLRPGRVFQGTSGATTAAAASTDGSDIIDLTRTEQAAADSACSSKFDGDTARYRDCLRAQARSILLARGTSQTTNADPIRLSRPEQAHLQAGEDQAGEGRTGDERCGSDVIKESKSVDECRSTPTTTAADSPIRPDLSPITPEEKRSAEAACYSAYRQGPATYNACLNGQLTQLGEAPRRPDLAQGRPSN